jgi:hypothetical protein
MRRSPITRPYRKPFKNKKGGISYKVQPIDSVAARVTGWRRTKSEASKAGTKRRKTLPQYPKPTDTPEYRKPRGVSQYAKPRDISHWPMGKDGWPAPYVRCPHCKRPVRSNHLENHIAKRCYKLHQQSSAKRAQRSGAGQKRQHFGNESPPT